MSTEAVERVWAKILVSTFATGRSGKIPVFNGNEWRVFRNSLTIYVGAENCADPEKVDVLRQNVVDLLGHYPRTVPQLEKLGVRVRALLNRQIKTYEDVVVWAESVFNTGPTDNKRPSYIRDTVDLAYDDVLIEVKSGREPVYVIPAAPRGSGVMETVHYGLPPKKVYGPRHEFTKLAFNKQTPKKKKPVRYRGKTAEGEPMRPRGRPRKDGLIPGSPEAKRANRKAEKERQKKREAREAKATITELHPKKQRLVRVGQQKAASS